MNKLASYYQKQQDTEHPQIARIKEALELYIRADTVDVNQLSEGRKGAMNLCLFVCTLGIIASPIAAVIAVWSKFDDTQGDKIQPFLWLAGLLAVTTLAGYLYGKLRPEPGKHTEAALNVLERMIDTIDTSDQELMRQIGKQKDPNWILVTSMLQGKAVKDEYMELHYEAVDVARAKETPLKPTPFGAR